MRAVALLAILAVVALLPSVNAHAEYLTSTPANGARVEKSPAEVSVTLTEAIEPSATTMTVTDALGVSVANGPLRIAPGANPVLTIALKSNLGPGVYTVTWKVLSKDSHAVTGSVAFGVATAATATTQPGAGSTYDAPSSMARAVVYAGYSLVLGAAFIAAWHPQRNAPRRGQLLLFGAAAHLAGVLILLWRTHDVSGQDWQAITATGVGKSLLLRAILGAGALGIAWIARNKPNRTGAPLAAVLLLAAAIFNAQYSHSFRAGFAAQALDWVHIAATATWVGGLVALAASWKSVSADAVEATGKKFGNIAMACVAGMAFSGTAVSLSLAGDAILEPRILVGSVWGKLLLAKVALALVMVIIAGINRYALLSSKTTGLDGAVKRIVSKVGVRAGGPVGPRAWIAREATIGLVVLVVAGFLTSINPPSAEAQGPSAGPVTLFATGSNFNVTAVIDGTPMQAGAAIIDLTIRDATTGAVLSGDNCGREECVNPTLMYGAGPETTKLEAHNQAPGLWTIHDVLWAKSGQATLTVDVSSADVYKDTVTFTFEVR